jgi:hypothetical protein
MNEEKSGEEWRFTSKEFVLMLHKIGSEKERRRYRKLEFGRNGQHGEHIISGSVGQ